MRFSQYEYISVFFFCSCFLLLRPPPFYHGQAALFVRSLTSKDSNRATPWLGAAMRLLNPPPPPPPLFFYFVETPSSFLRTLLVYKNFFLPLFALLPNSNPVRWQATVFWAFSLNHHGVESPLCQVVWRACLSLPIRAPLKHLQTIFPRSVVGQTFIFSKRAGGARTPPRLSWPSSQPEKRLADHNRILLHRSQTSPG